MLFYLALVFCVSCLLSIGYFFPHKEKVVQMIVVVILVCIAGFRYHVGIDYDNYIVWFDDKKRDLDFEFGYLAIMKFFRTLHLSYHFFFFFFSFATVLLVYLGIKKYTNNTIVAFLFYFLIPELYLGSFNLIRQSFSVGISFYAFYFLINKKYFVFAFLMFLGISIHYSAILPLLVFILVYKLASQINSKHIALMLLGSLVLSQLNFIQIFEFLFKNTRYIYYFDSPRVNVSLFKTLVLNGVALFVLFHFEKMKNKYPIQKYIMVLYFCSVIFMNLFNTFANIERLTYFFKIFEIIVIADLIYLGAKERKQWLLSCFYIYYLSAFIHTLNKDIQIKSTSKLIPYQTFILNNY